MMKNWNFHDISSPTFTIVNEYDINESNKIYHIDAYRLNSEDDFFAIGADEFLGNAITIIEWGENIINSIPKPYIHIYIKREYNLKDNNIREIIIEYISN